MKLQRSHLPERDMAKTCQKRMGCELAGDSEPKKPDEDTVGYKGCQKVKSKTWQQIEVSDENIDGKARKSLTRTMESPSSQDTDVPPTSSLPPIGWKEEQNFPCLNLAGKNVPTPDDSESLQITVTQDCGAHLCNSHAVGHDNCLCNGYSRKVTTVAHPIRHRLYEYEDFLSCLLNHHQQIYPLDSKRASLFQDASGHGYLSNWCRTVSDNGESFQVDLRNKSSPLCTKTARHNRSPDFDCNYRWTITVGESGMPQRAFSSQQQKECNREFQVQWKDSGSQMDFEKDFASGYQRHLKYTDDSGVLGYNFKKQEGRLISHTENPRIEVKDPWKSCKEPWRNPITNWKVLIKNSQNERVRPRLKESDRCKHVSYHHSSQMSSQCRVEPDCTNKESMNEQRRLNRKMKRLHESNVCEFSADIDWSNGKSGFHQDASNQKSNKELETHNSAVKFVPTKSGSDPKYSWKENESKVAKEPDHSNKPCSGHQRKDSWNGKGLGEIPSKESVLANRQCEAFSEEVKHKKQRKNSKTKINPEDENNKQTHNPMDSKRDLKTHWKPVKNESLDNYSSSERSFAVHHSFRGDYCPRERDFELDLGANGTRAYFHKHFTGDQTY